MNYSHPDEEDADDKWNQPEADSKHYVTFDTYTACHNINIYLNNYLMCTPISYILKIEMLPFIDNFIFIPVLILTRICQRNEIN